MTDQRSQIRRSRRRTSVAVYATTAALFAIVGGSLSVRMAQGQDPSLGSLSAQVTQTSAHHHHRGSTTKPLRTTASGHVIQAAQPKSNGAPSTAPAATHSTRHHSSEGHDA
jgi:hypothetical protein